MSAEKSRPGRGGSPSNCDATNGTGIVGNSPSPEETARALDIARRLVKAGVPVFVAPPAADSPLGFKLPPRWETSTPNLDVVNRWKPGWALAAVCGHALDVLDVDPRNGGDAGAAGLRAAGMWPNSYGQAATPSGGTHDLIAPLRVGKGVPAEGVDLQGGREDGTGRGFVFIAPTVRVAKDGPHKGKPTPYRWIVEPDVDRLAESVTTDDSGAAIAERARRGDRKPDPIPAAVPGADATEALARVQQLRDALAAVPDGDGNTEAARLAFMAGQYVGAGQVAEDTVAAIMLSALDGWSYRHPADRDKMRHTIRQQVKEGARFPRAWETTRADGPEPSGRLRAALLKRSELGKLPVPEPLITDVMHRETIVVLAGKFGSYKSFVTVGMGCSLAAGVPWMGYEVPEAVPVLYVAAEGAYGIRKRVDAWESAHGPVPDTFYLLPAAARLLVPADVAEVDELIRDLGIKALIIDTLHASAPGADENNSKEIGPLYDTLRRLRERHHVTTILVHHTGHAGERARGSSSIEDDADTAFVIKLEGDGRGADSQRTFHHRKAKDGALIDPLPLRLTLVPGTDSGYVEPGAVDLLPGSLTVETLLGWLEELAPDGSITGRPMAETLLRENSRPTGKTVHLAEAVKEYKRRAAARGAG